ncbi:nuclear protein 96-domain-containing protein [Paraphoma chrysanthemicola]|uniref:Nuclear protein 96-domain-containing protein n=1 Tax=Paraphoma chrysanthemicola TaxID=798071 RepID=A0A8K0QSP5_9PLEO|nr:nuclear protein 96-domain-containing protein [Paraphoma chrysanthemicola]
MSFGGGFGGFGSNNNNQSTGFGGFGANNNTNNNTTGGFGSSANTGTSIFGSNNNTGGSLFGGNTNTSSPFGGGGGFGSNTNTTGAFGSKPFGSSTTGGGLFGGASSGNTFGGFGATNNNNTTSTPAFGASNNTGGSLFGGQNKTGFGASTGGGLFGGGGNTTGGFGSTANNNTATTGFGANTGGFGANTAQPNNGTASTPFQAFSEKDGTTGNATQQYQTITFQSPYQNYSLEELRVADYNQGRRYGNQNGQAGAFGQSTGFGGFGSNNTTTTTSAFGSNTNTGGGLFGGGANTNTGSTFGQSTGTGFGSTANTTSGGLFGQNKPATGGLFGSSTTTPAAGTTGGLFGGGAANTGTTGGFGSGGGFGSSTTGGGGLFGNTGNQPKPGGLFGSSTTTSTPFGGGATNTGSTFGQSNTGGGLFGQNNTSTATPAFGAGTATTGTGGGLFGNTGGAFGQNNQTQAQAQPASGGLFGGFNQNNQQNQQKPGGLFGGASTTTTGGGLFGQQNSTPQQSGGLFGGSTANNQQSGGLFGQKPATTGGGLFGGSTANTGTTSGGLFGNLGTQNNQQNNGGSLFGGQNNQQKPGGLFGGSTQSNTGGSLFGGAGQNNNQSTMGGSLFSSQNNQQQNQQPSNSLFGASGSSLLNTSMATNPYGNDALFAGLATPTQSPGPLATPLSSSQKNKKSAILPQSKLNPSASTRLLTPQNKRVGGYGFTYSTYGTPNSASSQASPGLGGSLFSGGSSISRSLGKSLSTSNLRNSFTPETSILSPGAFSVSGRGYGNGSLKKLNVNRSLNTRIPLFDDPPQKRVSFAGGEADGLNGASSGETALVVRRDEDDASPQTVNGNVGNETPRPPMEQVNGSQLARVAEDSVLTPKSSSSVNIQPGLEPKAGSYWSSPTLDQLKKMSKQELKSVPNFIVGRHNIGQITFNMGKPVDLSNIDLDALYGDIVQLNPRNATVYGPNCSALPKPPLGTALNQVSEITLANSWPRNRAGKKDVKHLERLKRVGGTTFINYNQATGEWTFTVPHFSSYGLNDDDYSDDEYDESSELSPVPDTPAQAQLRSSQMTSTPQDESFASPTQSSPDDTFDFKTKKSMRGRAAVPGGFGDEVAYEEEDEMAESRGESFLGQRSVGSLDGQHDTDYSDEGESGLAQDQDMADSASSPLQTTELTTAKDLDHFKGSLKPKSILKASQLLRPGLGTPSKAQQNVFDDDWAHQLQRTISPKKQDRHALRESQGHVLREQDGNGMQLSQSVGGRNLTTAMDLMESLFGETEKEKFPKRVGHGIELPYSKRPKTAEDLNQLSGSDQDFHSCSKPHFGETGVLIYGSKGAATLEGGIYPTIQEPLIGAAKDIRFTRLPSFDDAVPETLNLQKQHTKIFKSNGVPFAKFSVDPIGMEFSDMAKAVAIDTAAGVHEQHAWQLLSLLFDNPDRLPDEVGKQNASLYMKEQLSDFWKTLVWDDAQKHAQQASSAEEKAIAHLSCNNIADACHSLLGGLDLRLATMVAQIGGDDTMRQSLVTQIEEWRRLDVLSEMQDSHRALYELLSGNCAQSEGKNGSGLENKAATFGISSRFALDWRRAFGLRLWYGIMAGEAIELAVAQFADAIKMGFEDVKPVPWFVEAGVDMGWNNNQAEDREDLLWGILKLYAASKLELDANIEDVLAPENVSGHPLNARLAFQLFHLFKSRLEDENEDDLRQVGMPTVRGQEGGEHRSSFMSSTVSRGDQDAQAESPLVELGDKLTLTYAASLHTPEHWTTAIWVYCHLSSQAMREHYIKSLVNQFSSTYSLEEDDATYTYLRQQLSVPVTWLHSAAALQAKTDGDALRQATHLIQAEELEEAHEVLCRKVGPDAIISRDYDPLRELMGGFLPSPANSPTSDRASFASARALTRRKEPVQGWAQGGQIYFDYIELLDLTGQRSTYRVDEDLNERIQELLLKLQRALEIASRDRLASCGLEERVALMEIAGTVAGQIAKTQQKNHAAILRLPLTEDVRLKHSCALSTRYYQSLMASGR